MARFSGKVGFVTGELVDDVWEKSVIERPCKGTVLNETQNYVDGDKVNEDRNFSERISIVADAYSTEKYTDIRYVVKAGTRWLVTSVQVNRPSLILSLGGVYVGEVPAPEVLGDVEGDSTPE